MRELVTPKWITAHVVVVVVAFVFVNLGLWQLRRLDEVKLNNAVAESRYNAPPEELWTLLDSVGDDLESLRFRRVSLSGEFDTDHEVLTRNQVYRETAGFHVVTPFVDDPHAAVVVNRGWIPLELDAPPIVAAAPAAGRVEIVGWVNLTQPRPALGPTDPASGTVDVLSRVDISRIEAQLPYDLAPVYVILEGAATDGLPVALPPPEFKDEGPHLAYAIQWFGFTLIGLIGYVFLIRRNIAKPGSRPKSAVPR